MWHVSTADRAKKAFARAQPNDRERLLEAVRELAQDPYAARHVEHLTNEEAAFRKRVGDWRIFFDLYPEQELVHVVDTRRRTTTTYRKR
ncbi:MAG: type II toxin-antitoxin system RelE/ParE family toxin [Candidatus Ryanbacteria bacterium]|nr:type II toxin-antitoxin system RelE/ParE family toxin [Candidatus Ryanbacteria bacterium]